MVAKLSRDLRVYQFGIDRRFSQHGPFLLVQFQCWTRQMWQWDDGEGPTFEDFLRTQYHNSHMTLCNTSISRERQQAYLDRIQALEAYWTFMQFRTPLSCENFQDLDE